MKDSTFIEDDATVDSRNASNEGPDENLDPEERSDETSSESDEDFEVSENITVLQEKLDTNMRILGDREKDIESLKVELTSTQADRERLHAEVTRLSELEEDSRRKIRLVHSERRVWNIAREEIRSELMRLYERVDTEYRLRLKAETDLSQSFREKREMQKELACLKVALAQYNINDHSGKEPHNDIQMLLEQINSLRSRNKLLEGKIRFLSLFCISFCHFIF
jgi:chromosome segregation ATPase